MIHITEFATEAQKSPETTELFCSSTSYLQCDRFDGVKIESGFLIIS